MAVFLTSSWFCKNLGACLFTEGVFSMSAKMVVVVVDSRKNERHTMICEHVAAQTKSNSEWMNRLQNSCMFYSGSWTPTVQIYCANWAACKVKDITHVLKASWYLHAYILSKKCSCCMSCTEYDYVYIVHCHHHEYTWRNVNQVVNSIHNYEYQATTQDNLLVIQNTCQLTKNSKHACMWMYPYCAIN